MSNARLDPKSLPPKIAVCMALVAAVGLIKFPTMGGLWPLLVGAAGFIPLLYLVGKVAADPLAGPPQQPRAVAWFTTMGWAFFVFYSIPLARAFRKFITNPSPELGETVALADRAQYGLGLEREVFAFFVLGCVALLGLFALKFLIQHRKNYAWYNFVGLAVVMLLYVYETIKTMDPNGPTKGAAEEAIHFIEYGVLGALFFSALSHRHRNTGTALCAIVLTSMCGTLDETVQWMTPKRFFDLRDIGLNAFSATMIAVLFGFVLRPKYFTWKISAATMRTLTYSVLGLLAVLTFVFSNTAKLQIATIKAVPYLQIYRPSWGDMVEYGYEYTHEQVGVFQSRLLPDQLKEADSTRGKEAAEAVMSFGKDLDYSSRYSQFLQKYSATVDPYMHEMRVHLHSRGRNLQLRVPYRDSFDVVANGATRGPVEEKLKSKDGTIEKRAAKYRAHTTSAVREHNILKHYFPVFMLQYQDNMTDEWMADLLKEQHPFDGEYQFKSRVSDGLIRHYTHKQILLFYGFLAVAMIGFNFWYGRKHGDEESSVQSNA